MATMAFVALATKYAALKWGAIGYTAGYISGYVSSYLW